MRPPGSVLICQHSYMSSSLSSATSKVSFVSITSSRLSDRQCTALTSHPGTDSSISKSRCRGVRVAGRSGEGIISKPPGIDSQISFGTFLLENRSVGLPPNQPTSQTKDGNKRFLARLCASSQSSIISSSRTKSTLGRSAADRACRVPPYASKKGKLFVNGRIEERAQAVAA